MDENKPKLIRLKISGILHALKIFFRQRWPLFFIFMLIIPTGVVFGQKYSEKKNFEEKLLKLQQEKTDLKKEITALQTQVESLKNEDPQKVNEDLKKIIKSVQDTFRTYSLLVEKISDAHSQGIKTVDLEKESAEIVKMLSEMNYASASGKITETTRKIDDLLIQKEEALVEKNPTSVPDIPSSQVLPNSGYRRQSVSTDRGKFLVDVVAAQVGTARVIVDTASDNDCSNDCPVLPLANYVQRNGGFAGINGSYFCPAEYPSCAGKTNSFDTLLMNSRLKKYFNSDNNKFSTVPLVAFDAGGAPIFKVQTVEWGKDTGVQAVIANHLMLVWGGNIVVPGGLSEKQQIKSNRSVVAQKGNIIYLMVIHSGSVSEAATVMKSLGIDNALNLDSGGSTALYYDGSYKVGPGRNLPNAVILAL